MVTIVIYRSSGTYIVYQCNLHEIMKVIYCMDLNFHMTTLLWGLWISNHLQKIWPTKIKNRAGKVH